MKTIKEKTNQLPAGYVIVKSGEIKENDLIWDRVDKRWALVFGVLRVLIGHDVNGDVARKFEK